MFPFFCLQFFNKKITNHKNLFDKTAMLFAYNSFIKIKEVKQIDRQFAKDSS